MDFEYNLLYSNGLDTVSSSHYPSGLHLCFIQRHLFSDLHISLAMEPALSLHWCSAHLDCKEIKPVSPAAAAAAAAAAKLLQLSLTLCNPIDGSPLGSAVPGILQARTLELVAISFSNSLPSALYFINCNNRTLHLFVVEPNNFLFDIKYDFHFIFIAKQSL